MVSDGTFTDGAGRLEIYLLPYVFVNQKEMRTRRNSAVVSLADAIDELGPITDETRMSIREPILDLIDQIQRAGEELKKLRFDVYDRHGKLRLKR